tara:strand:+ start:566 stop:1306 length:741 start_codon:yes stop_codon:yes gene_type:complete
MSNILKQHAIKHYGGPEASLPARLPYGDTYLTSDTGRFFKYNLDGTPREITSGSIAEVGTAIQSQVQGYYSLLSGFYFGGVATQKIITTEETNTWLDVDLSIDALGTFDFRTQAMKSAQAIGHTGTGASGDPIVFLLEGLTQTSTASVRAAMSFDPDEDGGRFESKLLFSRHSGTSPATDFAIEASGLAVESGADVDYSYTPNTQFFVGDTIDTNGVGDAGTVRLQVKADVAGTLSMREICLFIQS